MTACRHMETRTCPTVHPCLDACARFESDDPTPWTSADFRCGRCGHTFTATTEAEYVRSRQLHAAAHDLAAALLVSPDVRGQVLKLLGLSE